jgi:hypothetical protein
MTPMRVAGPGALMQTLVDPAAIVRQFTGRAAATIERGRDWV